MPEFADQKNSYYAAVSEADSAFILSSAPERSSPNRGSSSARVRPMCANASVVSVYRMRRLSLGSSLPREDPRDKRRMRYTLTTEAFAHIGLTRADELPRFGELRSGAEESIKAESASETAA